MPFLRILATLLLFLVFRIPVAFSVVYADNPADSLLFDLGLRLYHSQKYDSSILCLSNYLSMSCHHHPRRNPSDLSQSNKSEKCLKSMLYMGVGYNMTGKPEKAIEILGQGYRLLDSVPHEYNELKALFLFQTANALLLMMEFSQAVTFFTEALSYTKNDPELSLRIHENLGGIFYFREDYVKAEEQYQKALIIQSDNPLPDPLKSVELILNLSTCMADRKEYDPAFFYLQEAEKILRTSSESDPDVSAGYEITLGNLWLKTGNPDESVTAYERASCLIDLREKEEKDGLIRIYSGLADHCNSKLLYDSAIQYYEKACSLIHGESRADHFQMAEILIGIASSYMMKNEWEVSLGYYTRAEKLLTDTDIRPDGSTELQAVHPAFNPLLFRIRLERTLMISRIGLQQDSAGMIRDSYYEALRLIKLADQIEEDLGRVGSKLLLNEHIKDLYYCALETGFHLLRDDRENLTRQLFVMSDQSRNRILTDSYLAQTAKRSVGLPDSLIAREEELNDQISYCTKQLANDVDEHYFKYLDRLLESKKELDSLSARFARESPAYEKIIAAGIRVNPAEIALLLEKDEAMIEYFTGDSSLFAFLVRSDTLMIRRIPFTGSLRDAPERFIREIRQAEPGAYSTGLNLYRKIFYPVSPFNNSIKKLILIPDETLAIIPFEALVKSIHHRGQYLKPTFLVNDFEISYHFSAGLWAESNRDGKLNPHSFDFAGFAPVSFDWCRPDGIPENQEWIMSPLPFSGEEIERVAQMIRKRGGECRSYLGEDATRKNFRNNLDRPDILHVATHSVISSKNPGFSGLVFTPDTLRPVSQLLHDGILSMDEIFNLRLKADLLVLSACATGTGKVTRSEGVMALTRAFFTAGASNILYTLWNVTDRHTCDFMVGFYEGMTKGLSYSSALHETKLRMISNPATSLPRTWAPYVLLGH